MAHLLIGTPPADTLTSARVAVRYAALHVKEAEGLVEAVADRYRIAEAYPYSLSATFLAETHLRLDDAEARLATARTQHTAATAALVALLRRLDRALAAVAR